MTTPPSPLPRLDYLLILDLEAVCDDPTDPNRPEIVEFPWLVFELASLTVLDHKQIFIAPRWNKNPNPPPDAVRGLGTDVAFAASLEDAIIQFNAYVYTSFIVTGKNFCLLTDGPWDLNDLLFVEAARKAVILAPYFRTYIDLRTEFTRCYPAAPVPTDRRTMLSFLDISTEPRASGLDECVALSAVLSCILRDGHRLGCPEVVTEYDWAALASRVPAIATPMASAIPVGGIIRLRGLPWTCTEDDIAAFLHGLTIVPSGIHFVRNSQGKATGEAFIQLDSMEAVNIALTRHKEMMGKRYIEVFKSSPLDMSNHLGRVDARRHVNVYSNKAHSSLAGGAAMPPSFPGTTSSIPQKNITNASMEFGSLGSPSAAPIGVKGRGGKRESINLGLGSASINGNRVSYVVRVSGMPRGVQPDDFLPLFDGLEMVGDGIHPVREGGECTGEAFVELTSEAWTKKAVARSGDIINVGGMPVAVEIQKSSPAQLRAVFMTGDSDGKPRSNGEGRGKKNGGSNGRGGEGKYYVRIRNIADNVGFEEVVQLFEQFHISDADVKFTNDTPIVAANRGLERSAGERLAKVSFPTREVRDAALAANKKSASLGGARVILEDGGSDGKSQRPPGTRRSNGNGGGIIGGDVGASDSSRVVRMRGLPYSSTDDDIVQFFHGYQIAPGGISRGRDRHGRASGDAWVTFVSAEDAREAVSNLDKAHMGTRYIELKF